MSNEEIKAYRDFRKAYHEAAPAYDHNPDYPPPPAADTSAGDFDTVPGISGQLRRLADARLEGHECAVPCVELKDIADKLDAAWKRELASTCNAAVMRDALVEILDRTNREKARDYDAAIKGGILEIHDIANTALNQERAADALEKAEGGAE